MEPMSPAEQAVMKKVTSMLGYDPVGMRDLLHIIGHPDVIELTTAYLDEVKWPYVAVFSEKNKNWQKNNEINKLFLVCQQNYFNHVLMARGHVFLNEVYDGLGFERTTEGQLVGWKDPGQYMDFGIDQVPGSPNWRLKFNVEGEIYKDI